jgi:hypothetical protein
MGLKGPLNLRHQENCQEADGKDSSEYRNRNKVVSVKGNGFN